MQEFIGMAASVLGITEEAARDATARMLELVARVAPAADAQELLSKLPGASEFVKGFSAPPPPPSPGSTAAVMGSVGEIVSNVATAVQGAVGAGAAFLGLIGQFGLDPTRAAQFARLFVNFARQQAGSELVDRVLSHIPGAGQFFSAPPA
jgi:hypothetical protein